MPKLNLPHVGMRTIKTAVAVMLSYLVFVPFQVLRMDTGVLAYISPLYACIACIVCMQSSLEQTLQVGLSRFLGVFVGAAQGVILLFLSPLLEYWAITALLLGLACVGGIWVCTLLKRPAACAMACIVPCVMVLSGTITGVDRYYYAISRVSETVVGVSVAFLTNAVLPTNGTSEDKK